MAIKVDIRQLPFLSKAVICWGFVWRGFVVTLVCGLGGGLVGGLLGFVIALIGLPKPFILVIGAATGLMVGALSVYLYVLWLLRTPIGPYRLVLAAPSPR